MNRLIQVINKLQDAFTVLGEDALSLPQIAVVGGQSAGKSSVLENIVGKDFLPRGSGIVTRRPLVLKLVNQPNGTKDSAEFLHKQGRKYTEYADIRAEISNATENDPACANKSISDKPINLTIYSADVLDLTLIDLPGLTRVAVGDQPVDINDQIRALLMKYIRQENTIILAVSPANQDLANSDAIQLAKEVDPEGHRTVGVLTKLDLMDKGTNAMAVLNNEVIPLRLGYIPVVNRSQHDIDTNKNIDQQWAEEEKYFSSHVAYSQIKNKCGTRHLTYTLNKTLVEHIRSTLPEISSKISIFLQKKKAELAGLSSLDSAAKKSQAVLGCVVGYAQKFQERMEGSDDQVSHAVLSGGAKIRALFSGDFKSSIQNIDILGNMPPGQIRNIIKNSGGLKGGLFIPGEAFHTIVRQAVKELAGPADACVQLVFDELMKEAMSIETGSMSRYSVLRNEIRSNVRRVISERKEQTEVLVRTLIDMELAHINTDHPDFMQEMNLWDLRNAALYVEEQETRETQQVQHSHSLRNIPPEPVMKSNPLARGGRKSTGKFDGPRLMEGWLEKRSATMVGKGFTPRFCYLARRALVYSKNEEGDDVKAVELQGAIVTVEDCLVHVAPTSSKPVTFRCTDPGSAAKWGHSLKIGTDEHAWDAFVQASDTKNTNERLFPTGEAPSRRAKSRAGKTGRLKRTASMTDEDMIQTRIVEALLNAYFEIIQVKILDSVPKAVTLKLVKSVQNSLHTELVQSLYDPSRIDELLSETSETQERRQRLISVVQMMEEAQIAITKVKTDVDSIVR